MANVFSSALVIEGPSHSPPRRPADRRHEYSTERDAGQHYEDRDRDDYRHRSPPRRGRQGYRDRDREGYQSPDYSRSRSPRRGQSGFGPESREIMLEGFPVDMTEDDVSSIHGRTAWTFESNALTRSIILDRR